MLIRSFFPVVYTVYICVRCAPLHVYPNNHQFVTNNSILHFSCFAVLHTFNDGLLLYPPFFLFLFGERNFIPFNEHWCLYHVVLCRHMNSIWSVYLSWSPLAVDNKKNITNKRKRKEKKKTTANYNKMERQNMCGDIHTMCTPNVRSVCNAFQCNSKHLALASTMLSITHLLSVVLLKMQTFSHRIYTRKPCTCKRLIVHNII